jgi:K+-sensing histidine kinase KdpD
VANGTGRNHNVNWFFGTAISVGIAALLIFLARGSHRSVLVPIVFIVVVILCARYFGLVAGILGSIVSTALFEVFLFEPYGTVHIDDQQALSNLGLLLFAGIALSYANSKHDDSHRASRRTLKQ